MGWEASFHGGQYLERLRCELLDTNSASNWENECQGPKGRVGAGIWTPKDSRRVISPPNLHLLAGTLPKEKLSLIN